MIKYLLLLLPFINARPVELNNTTTCKTVTKENGNPAAGSMEFYVSPNGNDSNPGSRAYPFLSLEKAKSAVLKSPERTCVIWLSDGIYEINQPIVFDVEDIKNPAQEIFVKAENDEQATISGGKQIKQWQKNKDGFWVTNLKAGMVPGELFINDKRATRARFPNNGYMRVKKVGEDRRTNFYFKKNEFPIPKKTKDVELVLLHDWSVSRIGIKEINPKNKQLIAVDSIGAKNPAFFNLDHWEEHPRYFLENAIEFLDLDYEWVFDSENSRIILKLPENENPDHLKIVVPVSEGLIQVKGNKNQTIKNIHFEGITFRHCAWQIPEKGYCGVQACHFDSRPSTGFWDVVPAAVKAEWAENISLVHCAFENLGTSGLWFSTGCKNCSVTRSVFNDISGNGIMIGEGRDRLVNGNPWWKEKPGEAALKNSIEECKVANCGVRFFGAVGIWCGLTAETTIKNNEIYDLPYSGISIGWMWSPEPTPCRDNVIDGNHIHHILQTLSDGGGVYSLGLQPGSRVVNNHIHDVKINAGRAESNGMFFDEGTTDVLIENNLIYRIARSPLRFHKTTTNLVKDNYLFCTNENPPIRYNRTTESDIEKVNNRVFSDSDKNYKTELRRIIKKWGR